MSLKTKNSLFPITEDDLQEVYALLSDWFVLPDGNLDTENISFLKDSIQASLKEENSEHFLIALDQNHTIVSLLGYASELVPVLRTYVLTQKSMQLTVLMVKKSESSKGVGTRVLEQFEERTRSEGYKEIILTSSERWKDSWPFYTHLLYEDLGELPNTNGFHTKIFRKLLSK